MESISFKFWWYMQTQTCEPHYSTKMYHLGFSSQRQENLTLSLGNSFLKSKQGSTYLFEALLGKFVLSQPYVRWINMKTYISANFPSSQDLTVAIKLPYMCHIFGIYTWRIWGNTKKHISGVCTFYLVIFLTIS